MRGGANDTAVVRMLTTYAVSRYDPRPYLFAEFVGKMKQVPRRPLERVCITHM